MSISLAEKQSSSSSSSHPPITASLLGPASPHDAQSKPFRYQDTQQKYNNIICCEQVGNSTTYYVPAYLAIVIKRLEKYNFAIGAMTVCI
jgi:hypothetical protein